MDTRTKSNAEFRQDMETFMTRQQAALDRHDTVFETILTKLQSMEARLQSLETNRTSGSSDGSSGSSKKDRTSPFGINQPQTKLFFSKFTGTDPIGWIYLCEQYFEFAKISAEHQVSLALFHLEGIALQWYCSYTKLKGPTAWEELTQAVLQRFGPTDFDNPSESLSLLKQSSTVAAYTESFEQISNRIDGLSEFYLIVCYVAGLKDEIRFEVKLKKHRNLPEAIGLARLIEEKHHRQMGSPSLTQLPSTNGTGLLGPNPAPPLALPAPNPIR
ncbi:putative retrotransposon gag domain-containing protein [Helianthus annuus]|nr:putative retrotransposon gag domain-containing protein [Helianthus annuus]KAJ0899150.1 putative retrotransposon gag domain-containing protein [Helianthus annuus]